MTQIPQWLNTLTGRNLLREEVRQVRRALDTVFGDQLVQVGVWGEAGLFRRLARTRRAAVFGRERLPGVDAVSAPDALALTSDSIDAVLLPHTLELADDPHAVLREVDRVLRADGHLVVLGFNPWGWWGLRHVLTRSGFPPGSQRMIADGRLCDWLRLLDFRVHHASFYYFVPPLLRGAAPRQARHAVRPEESGPLPGVSALGRMAEHMTPALRLARRVPAFAGCYVLVARKQTCTMTPIRPAWRRRPALVGGVVNPTTRNVA
ncbi:MAG: methyltransferase domain-containing protein [Gammaproteobacteria bacterium]|nr:methyltransferase domain-containing protein [Gammaproteobacteria bacterium]